VSGPQWNITSHDPSLERTGLVYYARIQSSAKVNFPPLRLEELLLAVSQSEPGGQESDPGGVKDLKSQSSIKDAEVGKECKESDSGSNPSLFPNVDDSKEVKSKSPR